MSDYRLIPLHGKAGEGQFAKVDPKNFDWLSRYRWSLSGGYAVTNLYMGENTQFVVSMQRLILNAPWGSLVDHRNIDPLDNREENLRVTDTTGNAYNRRKTSKTTTSRFKGVWLAKNRKKPWYAEIRANKRKYKLGAFETEEEAALAYNNAALKLHGEFAKLNDL